MNDIYRGYDDKLYRETMVQLGYTDRDELFEDIKNNEIVYRIFEILYEEKQQNHLDARTKRKIEDIHEKLCKPEKTCCCCRCCK